MPRPAATTFPEIFQQHARFLWRTLMHLGVPSREAQDLCQEVMIIVHRRLPDFTGQSVRSWLYGICVRVASDYRRSARVRREIPQGELPEGGGTEDNGEQQDRRAEGQRLLRALEQLSEEKRAALVLYEVEELTLAEVSEALGVPLQTVYSRIKVARQDLRRALERESRGELGGAREAG
ncbi:MAG TPA: RNA polymerase sigma factor [Polyangiaceae bacterium]|nr:RNA polymerase sigma factor [Polyangiaceae bacterium]